IVPATPAIADHFPPSKCTLVQNFTLPGELIVAEPTPYADRPPHIAYVGGISRARGIFEMIEAMSLVGRDDVRLSLAGGYTPAKLEADVNAMPGRKLVDYVGWADREKVARLLGQARAGFVLFQ